MHVLGCTAPVAALPDNCHPSSYHYCQSNVQTVIYSRLTNKLTLIAVQQLNDDLYVGCVSAYWKLLYCLFTASASGWLLLMIYFSSWSALCILLHAVGDQANTRIRPRRAWRSADGDDVCWRCGAILWDGGSRNLGLGGPCQQKGSAAELAHPAWTFAFWPRNRHHVWWPNRISRSRHTRAEPQISSKIWWNKEHKGEARLYKPLLWLLSMRMLGSWRPLILLRNDDFVTVFSWLTFHCHDDDHPGF